MGENPKILKRICLDRAVIRVSCWLLVKKKCKLPFNLVGDSKKPSIDPKAE